jgi:hypothetical protein
MSMKTHETNVARSPSRRTFILASGGAVAGLATRAAAAPLPSPTAADRRASQLWSRRRRLSAMFSDAATRERAIEAGLPWWAKPGPRYAKDGALLLDGGQSSEPAIVGLLETGEHVDLRPDELTLRHDFVRESRFLSAREARARYDDGMRALSERRRAAQRERERHEPVGDDGDRRDRIIDLLGNVEVELGTIDCDGPAATAAAILEMLYETGRANDRDSDQFWVNVLLVRSLLTPMRPALEGDLAEDVDRVLACESLEDMFAVLDPMRDPAAAGGET